MARKDHDVDLPSVLVFAPQSKKPSAEYLSQLREYICNDRTLMPLSQALKSLKDFWPSIARQRKNTLESAHGSNCLEVLSDWIDNGDCSGVLAIDYGVLMMPLLVIYEITLYFQFLRLRRVTHEQVLDAVKLGGVQGYCGGFVAAVCVACSRSENQLIQNACEALKIATVLGFYSDIEDIGGDEAAKYVTAVFRLKYDSQEDELIKDIPNVFISGFTDFRTAGLVGRRKDVSKVEHRADSLGLIHQVVSMGGKWHSPESKDLAQDMVHLCERSSIFSNPEANQCLVPVRSNTTGEIITEGSFIPHIAASLWNQVAWQYLMSAVAEEVKHLKKDMHEVALFGLGDCVPKLAFARNGIKTKTFDVFAKVKHDQALFQPLPINEPTVHEPSIIKEPLSDYPKDAIAVTGVACRFPGSDDLQELWELLLSGSSRVEEVKPDRIDFASNSRLAKDKAFKGEKLYGNLLDNPFAFDHSFFSFNPREAASMDPQTRMLLMATYQALESSGYLPAHCRESGDDVGVFMSPVCADYYEHNSSHPPNAYMFTGTLRATICGRISHFMGWTGPSETIDTACASSLVAINRACKAIQCGECSMAVAGSANYFTSPNIFIELSRAGFLSHTGQCKPFDAKADGFCRGEGVGVIVLKPLASAVKSNDNILGVIRAVGVNQSGLAPSLTVPHGPTQQKLLRRVLRESRLSPHDISYMEAHGTGTSVGDPIEMSSIRDTFGGPSRRENLTIGSIKGNIGHTEGTAGVAGVIKALLIIQKKILPPQASFSSLNPTIEPLEPDKLEISTKPKPWTANGQGICVSSYGAGGCNAAAIVTPGPDMTASNSNRSSNGLYPFIVSADCTESVHKMGQKLLDFFSKSRVQDDLGDIAFTLANKRRLGPWRSCFLAGTEGELVASLQKLTHNQLIAPSIPKKVVLAFAGQNARSMHIDRRLIDTPSAFRTNFLACNDAMLQLGLPNMYSSIFNDTVNQSVVQLHCNTFAIQYSSAMAWIDCGLQVECVVGHSFGELTALAVSGILSLEDAIRVISGRAVAIENKWGPEHGAMMLINDTFINVRNLISSRKENLEIACLNAEKGQVVVGSHEAINCLDRDLQNSSIRYKLLDISHGYHSQLADPILADLERVAHKVKFSKPRLHFEACTSSPPESIDASHIVRHTREPVYFLEAVRRIEERCGPCTWVEAGFNTSIINLVKNAVEKSQESIFHNFTTSNKTEPMSTVAEATIKLWQEGLSLSYWNFQVHDHGYKQIWLPPYQFNLTTHVLPRLDPGFAHTEEVSNASEEVQKPSKDLVIPHGTINRDDTSWHLRMNTSSPRFKALVEGHVVAKSPLCPASAYIEAVVHAVALLMGNEAKEMAPYSFEDVSMGLPLTTSQNGLVLIALQQLDDRGSIGFSIYTDEGSAACSSTAYHAKGTFKCPRALENSMELDFQTMHRLVYRNVRSLLENDDAEVLRNKKCYQIFDRVVKYSEMLRVIQKLRTFESNAVGDVITPDLDEPSSSQIQEICDAATVDGIVQVLGLLINSSELCSQEEVLVAVGIDRFEVSSSCKFNVGSHWQVYATVDPLLNETKGDVLVFDASDSLVLVATGVKFQKNKLSQFEKLLASMTGEASTRRQSSAKGESRKLSGQREYSESPHRMTRPSRSNGTPSRKESLQGAEPHNAVLGKDNDDAFRPFDRTQKLEAQSSPPQDRGLQHRSESIEAEIEGKLSGETPRLLEEVSDDSEPSDGLRERYMEIVADISGISVEDISMDSTFEDLGLNSLSLMEVSSDIEAELSIELDKDVIKHDTTVQELLDKLGQLFKLDSKSGGAEFDEDATSVEVPNDTNIKLDEPSISDRTPLPDSVAEPVSLYPQVEASSVYVNGEAATSSDFHRAISDCNKEFDFVARKHAFDGYWDKVSPAQNRLVVQYIVEAFEELGVDLKKLQPHDKIPEVECLRKYRDLVSRLYGYLTEAGILRRGNDGSYSRSRKDISAEKSMDLGKSLLLDFSEYFSEISLLNTTGPHLANCLMGKTDPLKLLFGNSKSLQVLDEYYTNSPQAGTTNDLFLEFFKSYEPCHATDELRILEIGAGFGGTTNRLAKFFQKSGRNVSYYFTDVSPTLVRDSQKKYSQYPWIKFQTLDLAADPPDSLREEFDVVIGTNVVHATSNTVLALEHVNSLLKDNGVVILSEITKMLHWADLVFGLLDGWWAFRDGRDYPFQTTEAWFRDLSRAGFGECEATGGKTTESTTQPLIVGVKRPAQCPKALSQIQTQLREKSQRLTVPYKMSESGEILADIYLPRRVGSSKNLPIALMIHGGHVIFSRTCIRPAQTLHLLDLGFLPVSIDYRLAPEARLADGALPDVRDALKWARGILPSIMMDRGMSVNGEKVIAVGWSTGGQLAMSLSWTAAEVGTRPPEAILAFYPPTNYHSRVIKVGCDNFKAPSIAFENVSKLFFSRPISSYNVVSPDFGYLTWNASGDSRSELLLRMFKEEDLGRKLVINGWGPTWDRPLDMEDIAYIDPLSQARAGTYTSPTFITHGDKDDVAPHEDAVSFVHEIKRRGVRSELLTIKGAGHHDLDLLIVPGQSAWDYNVVPAYKFAKECVEDA